MTILLSIIDDSMLCTEVEGVEEHFYVYMSGLSCCSGVYLYTLIYYFYINICQYITQ